MIIDYKNVAAALQEAIDKSVRKMDGKADKPRKFDETIDVIINVRELDIKNPNNRIEQEHLVPHPVNDDKFKVCFFASGDLEQALKKRGLTVINNDALDLLQKKSNKDKRAVAKKYDYFVSQTEMMRNVAKVMARFLGPRNKMPKPQPKGFGVISAKDNLDEFLNNLKRIIKLDMKKQLLVQAKVGRKSLPRDQLQENLESVITMVESKLPSGNNNIKSIFVKTTMSPAIKVKEGSKK